MKLSVYLNELEVSVIEQLAEGKRMHDIRESTKIPHTQSYRFYQLLEKLRKKTGILHSQSVAECRAYIEKMRAIPEPPPLTEEQGKLILWLSEQKPPLFIAPRLHCTPEELPAKTDAALRAIGISTAEPKIRRMQCRAFFAHYGHPLARPERLSETHWRILRAIAEGSSAIGLGYPPLDARVLSREACQRAGVTCPGRDAQRALVRAFLASHDAAAQAAPAAVSMDDPAFN